MNLFDFSLRIMLAVGLGAVIGLERQYRQRGAGLRTNALVAMGAAAFVAISAMVSSEQSQTRIAAQVVSGIGFLGGGIILREGLNVRGLNTAATLWCSAAVGTLAGSGFLGAAVITAMVILGANVLLRPVAQLLNQQPLQATEIEVGYRIQATCLDTEEHHIRTLLLQAVAREALLLKGLRSEDIGDAHQVRVEADVVMTGRSDKVIEEVASRLSVEPGIRAMSWEIIDQNGGDHT